MGRCKEFSSQGRAGASGRCSSIWVIRVEHAQAEGALQGTCSRACSNSSMCSCNLRTLCAKGVVCISRISAVVLMI
jgi:hypothetical protein